MNVDIYTNMVVMDLKYRDYCLLSYLWSAHCIGCIGAYTITLSISLIYLWFTELFPSMYLLPLTNACMDETRGRRRKQFEKAEYHCVHNVNLWFSFYLILVQSTVLFHVLLFTIRWVFIYLHTYLGPRSIFS